MGLDARRLWPLRTDHGRLEGEVQAWVGQNVTFIA